MTARSTQIANDFLASQRNKSTRSTYKNALEAWNSVSPHGTVDWLSITPDEFAVLWGRMRTERRPATVALSMAAARGVWKLARSRCLMSAEQIESLLGASMVGGAPPVRPYRQMTEDEAAALGAAMAMRRDVHSYRDAALFASVMCGMTRDSVRLVSVGDYQPETIGVGPTIRLKSDAGGHALLPVGPAAPVIDEWLAIRGTRPGALFSRIGRAKQISVRPIAPQAAFQAAQKAVVMAQMPFPAPLIGMRLGGPQAARAFVAAWSVRRAVLEVSANGRGSVVEVK